MYRPVLFANPPARWREPTYVLVRNLSGAKCLDRVIKPVQTIRFFGYGEPASFKAVARQLNDIVFSDRQMIDNRAEIIVDVTTEVSGIIGVQRRPNRAWSAAGDPPCHRLRTTAGSTEGIRSVSGPGLRWF